MPRRPLARVQEPSISPLAPPFHRPGSRNLSDSLPEGCRGTSVDAPPILAGGDCQILARAVYTLERDPTRKRLAGPRRPRRPRRLAGTKCQNSINWKA